MNEQREKALQFLMTQKGGVISTLAGDQPQSAFVYYEASEDFGIYFVTTLTTRKYKNLQTSKKVSFVVATVKPPQTVQIDGTVEVVNDPDKVQTVLANYMDTAVYTMKNEPPITKLEWEKGLVVYKITPTWLRWSDFSDAKTNIGAKVQVVLVDTHK